MIMIFLRSTRTNVFIVTKRYFSSSKVKFSKRAGFLNHLEMLSEERDYISRTKEFIPQLTSKLHKGQCGRIGVFGGSLEYTGAPYFAAISALKLGSDLVHVFCSKSAAPIIKSYSPELIVHPLLDDPDAMQKIIPWIERLHTLLIGPGLGREEGTMEIIGKIIIHCKNAKRKLKMPLVIDADGLFLITQNVKLIQGYQGPVVLTPNAAEYCRLCEKISIDSNDILGVANYTNSVVVSKGEADIICNGMAEKLGLQKDEVTIYCRTEGSMRRCGGQGDLLSGCISVLVAWFYIHKYNPPLADDFNLRDVQNIIGLSADEKLKLYRERYEGFSLAAFSASAMTRYCSSRAYKKYGRSMTASDMIPFIHEAFENYFEK